MSLEPQVKGCTYTCQLGISDGRLVVGLSTSPQSFGAWECQISNMPNGRLVSRETSSVVWHLDGMYTSTSVLGTGDLESLFKGPGVLASRRLEYIDLIDLLTKNGVEWQI